MQKQIVLLCTALMFGYFFLALVLMALASNCGDQVMRIRLTKKLPLENVFSWWMESSDEVGRAYQEMAATCRPLSSGRSGYFYLRVLPSY